MLVMHIQVAPIQMHISMQQYQSQDRKTLLCQVLWSVDINPSPPNYVTSPMLRGNPSGTLPSLLQPSCFSWDKSFSYQSRGSFRTGKTQGQHSSPPCSLHHLDLLCPPQESPRHRLVCCQHAWSNMWPRRIEKPQMAYLWQRILLGHRQERDYITWVYCSRSMAASACFLCSTSFPTRKGGVQLFRSSWILCHKTTK